MNLCEFGAANGIPAQPFTLKFSIRRPSLYLRITRTSTTNPGQSRSTKAFRYIMNLVRDLALPLLIAIVFSFLIADRTRLGFWPTFAIAAVAVLVVGWISAVLDKD